MGLPKEKTAIQYLNEQQNIVEYNHTYKKKLSTKRRKLIQKKKKYFLALIKEQRDIKMGVTYQSGINLFSVVQNSKYGIV